MVVEAHDAESGDQQDGIWIVLVCGGGKAGDAALRSLHRKYYAHLHRFVVQQGLSADKADDVVHEAFIRMYKGACGFRQESRFSTWLFQIARNAMIDLFRKDRPEQTFDDETWLVIEAKLDAEGSAHQVLPGESDPAEDLQDCFDDGFGRFARTFPQCASVLDRVVKYQWSITEIADLLGRTEGATREYLSQCRKKLKPFLEPCRQFLDKA